MKEDGVPQNVPGVTLATLDSDIGSARELAQSSWKFELAICGDRHVARIHHGRRHSGVIRRNPQQSFTRGPELRREPFSNANVVSTRGFTRSLIRSEVIRKNECNAVIWIIGTLNEKLVAQTQCERYSMSVS